MVVGGDVVGTDIVPFTTLFVVTTDTTASPIRMELSADTFVLIPGGPMNEKVLWLPSIEEPSSVFVNETNVSRSFSSIRSEEVSFTIGL